MKTIGMIGGMSWKSSIEYYRIINELVSKHLGGLHSAKTVMYSVDFGLIEHLMSEDRWEEIEHEISVDAKRVQQGGADCLIICTNTIHKVADEVEKNIDIPLLHIADVTAKKIRQTGLDKVGLLGTKFTMTEDFYKRRLLKHGVEVVLPEKDKIEEINRIIFEELVIGKTNPESKEFLKKVLHDLNFKGAEGIILGCTELPLILNQHDTPMPLFDTTFIHAEAAVDFALGIIK